jgi:hypothetical protein
MHSDPQLYALAIARHEEKLQRSLAAYAARTPSTREHVVGADLEHQRPRHARMLDRLLRRDSDTTPAPRSAEHGV